LILQAARARHCRIERNKKEAFKNTAETAIDLCSSGEEEEEQKEAAASFQKGDEAQSEEFEGMSSQWHPVEALGSQDVGWDNLELTCNIFCSRFKNSGKEGGKFLFMEGRLGFTSKHSQLLKITFSEINNIAVYASHDHLFIYFDCAKSVVKESSVTKFLGTFNEDETKAKTVQFLLQIDKCALMKEGRNEFVTDPVEIRKLLEKHKTVQQLLRSGDDEEESRHRYARLFDRSTPAGLNDAVLEAFGSYRDALDGLYNRKEKGEATRSKKC